MSLLFALRSLSVLADDILNILLQLFNLHVVVAAGGLQVCDVGLHLILTLFGHQSFAHTVSNRTLIQSLISLYSHLDLVTHTDEEEAPFGAVYSNLADQLIEALSEKFFSKWTDSSLTRLTSLNCCIELVLQIYHVNLCGGLG